MINTFIFRAINICSKPDLLQSELDYLRAVAIDRGFSPAIIDRCVRKFSKINNSSFKPELNKGLVVLPFYPKISYKISSILKKFDFFTVFSPVNKLCFSNLKDSRIPSNNWGIYKISCQCGLSYIGQTKRALRFRLNEHKNDVKNQELNKSTIAVHCWNFDHNFDFFPASIIQHCSSILNLDFYEAYHIKKKF